MSNLSTQRSVGVPKARAELAALPPYVPAKSLESIRRENGLDQVLRLAANENLAGSSPKAVAAMLELLQKETGVNLYPDGGSTRLRHKLAVHLGVSPERLVIGNGSFELLTLLARTFIHQGSEAVYAHPSFGWYALATREAGGVPIAVPLENHKVPLETIYRHITANTSLIWLSNPNNPTGTYLSADELEGFLQKVPPHIAIVLDEAYYEFARSETEDYPESVQLLGRYSNVIALRTFSKVYGLAGMRVGYAIAHEELISELNRVRLPINVNALAQTAAEAGLEDTGFVEKVLQYNEDGKKYLYEVFDTAGLAYIPSRTNFVMVDLQRDSGEIVRELLKQGILVRGGAEFGMLNWLRVTVGLPEHNRRFAEALLSLQDREA